MAKYEDVVNLALRRSFFFPSAEIYPDAPAGFYDYGLYGVKLKNKIIGLWRKHLVHNECMLEIDGSAILPSSVFKSSGHLKHFNDPVTQCKKCNLIHRADHLLEKFEVEVKESTPDEILTKALRKHKLTCPKCKGNLSEVRRLNMMVKADVGIAKNIGSYLRPETCQNIFINFQRLFKTMRVKLPVGVAQVGKAVRNEISPRQSLLRQVEFSQMEAEVFFDPQKINDFEEFEKIKDYKLSIQREKDKKPKLMKAQELVSKKLVSGKLIAYYIVKVQQLFEKYGFDVKNMRFRKLGDDERAFYSKEAWDFEVKTSVGWLELIANNYRTDYDLSNHSKGSGKDLSIRREDGSKFVSHVWEISIGLDRTFYAILENSLSTNKRTVLSLPVDLVPLQTAVFPLLSNKPELVKKAKEVYNELKDCYEIVYDDSGSIGKRYARMDEIGCPVCITVDFDSLKNNDVTIRDRDTTKQKRVKMKDLKDVLFNLLTGTPFGNVR